MMSLSDALAQMPLIAILRGLAPADATAVADVLVSAGLRAIEVPLNSPEPLRSIERIASHLGEACIVGAGTVLTGADARAVGAAGGRFVVAPNLSAEVGAAARESGLAWCPGILTPTEAFAALEQGADMLKVFPAELVPPNGIAAMRAVLPRDATVAAVGGITPDRMEAYVTAGVDGFGLGSALFKPGLTLEEIGARAAAFVAECARLHLVD